MGRRKKNTRDYKAIALKRRETLIAKYGSWEAYQAHWQAKRTDTLKAELGEEGLKEALQQYGAQGGHARAAKRQKRRPRLTPTTK